jgi:hypothetical protein
MTDNFVQGVLCTNESQALIEMEPTSPNSPSLRVGTSVRDADTIRGLLSENIRLRQQLNVLAEMHNSTLLVLHNQHPQMDEFGGLTLSLQSEDSIFPHECIEKATVEPKRKKKKMNGGTAVEVSDGEETAPSTPLPPPKMEMHYNVVRSNKIKLCFRLCDCSGGFVEAEKIRKEGLSFKLTVHNLMNGMECHPLDNQTENAGHLFKFSNGTEQTMIMYKETLCFKFKLCLLSNPIGGAPLSFHVNCITEGYTDLKYKTMAFFSRARRDDKRSLAN